MKNVYFVSVLIAFCAFVTSAEYVKSYQPNELRKNNEMLSKSIPTEIEEFPWMVSIEIPDYRIFFGGVLISPNWVLTEADYLRFAASYSENRSVVLRFGANNREDSDQTQTGLAENFIYNNLGLIMLDTEPFMGLDVQPIRLPSLSQVDKFFLGTNSSISGWPEWIGLLRYSTMQTISNLECGQYYSGVLEDHICAVPLESVEICEWHYGVPLTVEEDDGENTLIGMVVRYCAPEGYPYVFTRIGPHLSWISEITGIEIRP